MAKAKRRGAIGQTRGSWAWSLTINFRGKRYYFYRGEILRLSTAKKIAKGLMGKGYKIRIIHTIALPPTYAIYVSPEYWKAGKHFQGGVR